MGRLIEHEATGPRKLDESDIDPEKGAFARDGSGRRQAPPLGNLIGLVYPVGKTRLWAPTA
jgi:hypothetical protein